VLLLFTSAIVLLVLGKMFGSVTTGVPEVVVVYTGDDLVSIRAPLSKFYTESVFRLD
jgi:hypothetical protein